VSARGLTVAVALAALAPAWAARAQLAVSAEVGVGVGFTVDAEVGPLVRAGVGYAIGGGALRLTPGLSAGIAFLGETTAFDTRLGVTLAWRGPVELGLTAAAGVGRGALDYLDVHPLFSGALSVMVPMGERWDVGAAASLVVVPGDGSKTAAWMEVGPRVTIRL
jgi:hypothetical protein